jgi:hypothetical protein
VDTISSGRGHRLMLRRSMCRVYRLAFCSDSFWLANLAYLLYSEPLIALHGQVWGDSISVTLESIYNGT